MANTAEILVEVGGATVSFRASSAELAAYAERHLEPLRSAESKRPAVIATLAWHEGPVPGGRLDQKPWLASMERIDRDLYRGEDSLAWFRVDDLPGLQLMFRWDGAELHVTGDFFHHLSARPMRDRVKRLLYRRRAGELARRRFTTLLYYLVYYPAFWWLERTQDLHPIHAAGVEIDGAVVVLAGPSGVGKSTLSVALAASPGGRHLSDTFLLHRGATVRPVREPILIDDWARDWLGEAAGVLRPIEWRYCLGRRGYHFAAGRRSEGGDASLLLFPRRSREATLRPIDADRARGQVAAGGMIVNDLRRYFAYAAVLESLAPSPLGSAREAALGELAEHVPSFELGLTADLSRAEVVRRIRELLPRPGDGIEAPKRMAATQS
jgi:hypothetical protein